MAILVVLLLATTAALPDPLAVDAVREAEAVQVSVQLTTALPAAIETTLAAGAEVRLSFPIRMKAKRRLLWDRRLWSGELVTIAAFDPVTGRYRCQVILDGVITSTHEVESVAAAQRWLTSPPAVRIELPGERREDTLKLRVRAVFSRSTTWLIFPTQDATPWVELILGPDPAASGADG